MEWCDPCQFGRLAGQFDATSVAEFYAVAYYTHEADAAASASAVPFSTALLHHLAWRADYGIDFVPEEIPRPASELAPSVCDIGCGNGDQLRKFKALGYDVVGVEPDEQARGLAQDVETVYAGTAEEIPAALDGRVFDVVLMSHVLEHCIDPALALANVRKMLGEQSRLVIEVPNNAALGFWRQGAVWPWADIPRHINFFTIQSLERLLQDAGFEIERTFYTGYCRQYSAWWLGAEREIWSATRAESPPDFERAAWGLLAQTAFAGKDAKYDSVRVHARLRR
jgi:SAM-dependent methyltransferase